MASDRPAFHDDHYDQFPEAPPEFGPDRGFNTWKRLNDESLFTDEALKDPTIRAFVDAPISITYAQFKSSYRESEYFLHVPHLAMTGRVEGIEGTVNRISGEDPRTPIATLVVNHERTLAMHITRSIVMSGGDTAGQMVHKETPP